MDKDFIDEVLGNITFMIGDVTADAVARVAEEIIKADVIILFGNGGSYANATHMACDLLLRTKLAKTIHCIGDNGSMFSACGNDYSFEEAVAIELERFVQWPGHKVVILFSTSGDSKNIVRAAKTAKKNGCTVIAIFGRNLDKVEGYTDIALSVNGKKASQIEAVHAALLHAIVDAIRHHMGEKD